MIESEDFTEYPAEEFYSWLKKEGFSWFRKRYSKLLRDLGYDRVLRNDRCVSYDIEKVLLCSLPFPIEWLEENEPEVLRACSKYTLWWKNNFSSIKYQRRSFQFYKKRYKGITKDLETERYKELMRIRQLHIQDVIERFSAKSVPIIKI